MLKSEEIKLYFGVAPDNALVNMLPCDWFLELQYGGPLQSELDINGMTSSKYMSRDKSTVQK